MKYITLLLTAAALAAGCGLYTACKKECPTQPPPVAPWHNLLQLKATQVSIRWAQLQWKNDSITVSHYYVLLRNNKDTLYADSVNYKDSVVTVKDTGLQPGTPYTYTLYRVFNKQPWDTSSISITTLAITNPNLIFDETDFGANGGNSYLRGVWASSPTDVWMCGFIDSSETGGGVYDIIHYDGTKFHFTRQGGTCEGVSGVDSGDVWFCGGSGGTYVEHYSDGNWIEYNISGDTLLGNKLLGQLYGIYATPDKQWVYTVSVTGHILRLNRATDKWEDMPNPANGKYGLRDVIGFGDSPLYAVGSNASNLSVVLKYDGTQWSTILTSVSSGANDSTTVLGNLNGINGSSPDSLYVVGDYIYKKSGSRWLDVSYPDRSFEEDAFAESWNRVFICGDYFEIFLWNGEAWYRLSGGSDQEVWERIFAVGNDVYVVGFTGGLAAFRHGHY